VPFDVQLVLGVTPCHFLALSIASESMLSEKTRSSSLSPRIRKRPRFLSTEFEVDFACKKRKKAKSTPKTDVEKTKDDRNISETSLAQRSSEFSSDRASGEKETRAYANYSFDSVVTVDDGQRSSISAENKTTEEEHDDNLERIIAAKDQIIKTDKIRNSSQSAREAKSASKEMLFLAKFKNKSYLHVKWLTQSQVEAYPCGKTILTRFLKKYQNSVKSNFDDSGVEEYFNPDFAIVERIVSERKTKSINSSEKHKYLVKFKGLQYADMTWEDAKFIEAEYSDLVDAFHKRNILPSMEIQKNSQIKRCQEAQQQHTLLKETIEKLTPTPFLNENLILRDYQLDGVRWLIWNLACGRCGILADEMGLGKTVQALSFLWWLKNEKHIKGPFLIVCPLVTLDHWVQHATTLTDFNVVVWHGNAKSRDLILQYEFYYDQLSPSESLQSNLFKFDILLTTYEFINKDITILSRPYWKCLIIDEGQRLKSKTSKLFGNLVRFRSEYRLVMTGTPLQNNVQELWAMLNFVDAAKFPSYDHFREQFGELMTHEQIKHVQQELAPYILRRTKEDVEKSIPNKEEIIIELVLTAVQKTFYRAVLEKNREFLSLGSKVKSNIPSLINIMMELRKICDHPFLVRGAEEVIIKDIKRDERAQSLIATSSKMVFLDKLLAKLLKEGHKVLIFSQMVHMLNILEDFLIMKNYRFERINGKTNRSSRVIALKNFKENHKIGVMLLSTRACSVGINLTVSDTVILYDSDWNPQCDLQAQARVHRIGQTKNVQVYRLLTRNTYEAHMFTIASKKLGLNRAILGNSEFGGFADKVQHENTIDPTIIDKLLRYGAYHLYTSKDMKDSSNNSDIALLNEDLETIMKRSTTITYHGNQEKNELFANFSKATFVLNENDITIDIDDENFWENSSRIPQSEIASHTSSAWRTSKQRNQTKSLQRFENGCQKSKRSIQNCAAVLVVTFPQLIDRVMQFTPRNGK
jgi:SNF2 family DNA or RNA helicase